MHKGWHFTLNRDSMSFDSMIGKGLRQQQPLRISGEIFQKYIDNGSSISKWYFDKPCIQGIQEERFKDNLRGFTRRKVIFKVLKNRNFDEGNMT